LAHGCLFSNEIYKIKVLEYQDYTTLKADASQALIFLRGAYHLYIIRI